MTTHATGKFKVQSWDEQPYSEIDSGGKLTRASVTQAFEGDLEGDGSVEWLMCYRPDETADFVGLQRVSGRLGERSGSFVLRTEGTFDGKEAKGEWTVVPGSGSGELAQLRGEGGFSAPLGSEASVTLDYDLE
jgi:Protein of unknown function (DUF3224)